MNTKRNPAVTPLGFRMAWGEETPSAYTVKTPKFARKLEWTNKAPTVPGWYWITVGRKREIFSFDGVKSFPESVTAWLGPLPMPELPND